MIDDDDERRSGRRASCCRDDRKNAKGRSTIKKKARTGNIIQEFEEEK